MKIVQAIHAFPPYSRAGSENYVEALAAALSRRHEVTVFHRIAAPDRPEYELTRGTHGLVPVVRMNRSFSDLQHFEQTYRSRPAAEAFASFLESAKPDVVHFHHLTCLSTTCVSEVKRRGIPIVCTLHDFWILCPRSQLIRRDQSLCDSNTDADCVNCMSDQLCVSARFRRARSRWRQLERFGRVLAPALRRLARRITQARPRPGLAYPTVDQPFCQSRRHPQFPAEHGHRFRSPRGQKPPHRRHRVA